MVKFSNNAITALSFDIDRSATTIVVRDGSVFPALSSSDHTYITLEDRSRNVFEIVKCTARSGDSLTVERGVDGTRPVSFAAGTMAEGRLNAAALNEVAGGSELLVNSFTGDGSTTVFALSVAAVEANTWVYFDGVYQHKLNYTVSASTPAVITFSVAPANAVQIEIISSTHAIGYNPHAKGDPGNDASISADADNRLSTGTDGGIFAPAPQLSTADW